MSKLGQVKRYQVSDEAREHHLAGYRREEQYREESGISDQGAQVTHSEYKFRFCRFCNFSRFFVSAEYLIDNESGNQGEAGGN